GRVLLRFEENPGLDVGAPPSVRKGVEPEHLRTRGGCSYRSRGTPGFDVGESRSWWCSCDNASAPSGAEVGAAYFGVGQQLLSAALHDDAAVLHDVAPVGQFQRLVGVLFDQ